MAERTRRGPVAAWWRRRRDPSGSATRNREARQFWARLPGLSFAILLGAVACLFSTFGFLVDVRLLGRQSGAELTVTVALSAARSSCGDFGTIDTPTTYATRQANTGLELPSSSGSGEGTGTTFGEAGLSARV